MTPDQSLRSTLMAERPTRRRRRLIGRLSLRDFWQAVDPKEEQVEPATGPEPAKR